MSKAPYNKGRFVKTNPYNRNACILSILFAKRSMLKSSTTTLHCRRFVHPFFSILGENQLSAVFKRWHCVNETPEQTSSDNIPSPRLTLNQDYFLGVSCCYLVRNPLAIEGMRIPHRHHLSLFCISCCLAAGFGAIFSSTAESLPNNTQTETLWYDSPGEHAINEGLPVGNGRMGLLIPGQVEEERIVINEDSVWSGYYCENADNPAAAENLEKIRKLLLDGEVKAANELIIETQVPGNGPHDPRVEGAYGTYQMLASLHLSFPHAEYSDYRRELDLKHAAVKVDYKSNGTHYSREFISSRPDQVMAIRLDADREEALSFKIALRRPQTTSTFTNPTASSIQMSGTMPTPEGIEGLQYATLLKVETQGGTVVIEEGNSLSIQGADSAIIWITAATNYDGVLSWPNYLNETDPAQTAGADMEKVSNLDWNKVRERQIEDHMQLYNRTSFELRNPSPETANIPTDHRLQKVIDGEVDPILSQLYFNLGKYLLIASSRPGDLAANLQGIWSDAIWDEENKKWHYYTPWNGDYHTNINVQMNYWPAEVLNLPECAEPLHDLIRGMVAPGTETARIQHNCEGWTVHTLHNVWGSTTPGGWATWGHFPMAGPWMTSHLWEHYLFTQDEEFLASVWPIIQGSAAFVMNWLIEDPQSGLLISGPSASPENKYTLPDGTEGFFCMAPTMDQMIAWQMLTIADKSQYLILQADQQTHKYKEALSKLKGPQIGPDGRLLEWAEPYEEPTPGHRHISHLYGLHPSNQLSLERTPELTEAARKSLQYRLAHGGGHTGWSRAWVINFWARLHNGEQAHHNLLELFRHSTLLNLFDSHPPFQIDGNFGATAGICEMLLQSHEEDEKGQPLLRLLPALPTNSWPDGKITGLIARGAIEVNIKWKDGQLQQATFFPKEAQTITISYAGTTQEMKIDAGKGTAFIPKL